MLFVFMTTAFIVLFEMRDEKISFLQAKSSRIDSHVISTRVKHTKTSVIKMMMMDDGRGGVNLSLSPFFVVLGKFKMRDFTNCNLL